LKVVPVRNDTQRHEDVGWIIAEIPDAILPGVLWLLLKGKSCLINMYWYYRYCYYNVFPC
jgi:hypothetical protein